MAKYLNYKDAKRELEGLSSKYQLTVNYTSYMTELRYEGQLVMTNHHPGDCPVTEVMYGFALNYLPFGRKAYMIMAELAMTPWGYLEGDQFVVPLFLDFNRNKMTLLARSNRDEANDDFPFAQVAVDFREDVPKQCLLTEDQIKTIATVSGDEYTRYNQAKIKPSQLEGRIDPWRKRRLALGPKLKHQGGSKQLKEALEQLSNLHTPGIDGYAYIRID